MFVVLESTLYSLRVPSAILLLLSADKRGPMVMPPVLRELQFTCFWNSIGVTLKAHR